MDPSGNVPFYHQPTKGSGPVNNPSKVLSKEVNVSGDPIPQNAIYADPALGTVRFPIQLFIKKFRVQKIFISGLMLKLTIN